MRIIARRIAIYICLTTLIISVNNLISGFHGDSGVTLLLLLGAGEMWQRSVVSLFCGTWVDIFRL